jgi:hypothetical protein
MYGGPGEHRGRGGKGKEICKRSYESKKMLRRE